MSSPLRIPPAIAAEIDRLATAVAKDPRSKDFLPLADEYIKAGMWQEAAAVLEDGLKVYPGFVTAMAALGRVYDQVGQAAKAKAILEDVVKQRPDNLRAHRILAKLYHAEGQAELALRSCTAILNANPFDEEALALKRTVTGAPDDPPPSKLEKKRSIAEAPVEKITEAVPAVPAPVIPVLEAALPSVSQTDPTPAQIPAPPAVQHAAAIARLEVWLGNIQAKRRSAAH
ncbi:MAG: TPRREGION domain-containing protein [Nitrospira sp.]|nr:tetratricopeptide repeat protein [Nitrospira sp.]ULA57964.1 MAG: TPRREGION domain-containing protein [Nitrospira sp.]